MPERGFTKYDTRGAYHWQWYRDNTHDYRDLVDRSLTYFTDPGTLLDVGCGDGLISYRLYLRGFRVTGIDSSGTGVRLGRQRIAAAYRRQHWRALLPEWMHGRSTSAVLCDNGLCLEELSIFDLAPGRRFDYSLCHEVIEHVDDVVQFVDTVMGATDRYAVFTTPNGAFHRPGPHDVRLFTAKELMQLMGARGIELLEENETRICVRVTNT